MAAGLEAIKHELLIWKSLTCLSVIGLILVLGSAMWAIRTLTNETLLVQKLCGFSKEQLDEMLFVYQYMKKQEQYELLQRAR